MSQAYSKYFSDLFTKPKFLQDLHIKGRPEVGYDKNKRFMAQFENMHGPVNVYHDVNDSISCTVKYYPPKEADKESEMTKKILLDFAKLIFAAVSEAGEQELTFILESVQPVDYNQHAITALLKQGFKHVKHDGKYYAMIDNQLTEVPKPTLESTPEKHTAMCTI